jgi:transposase
VLRLTLFESSRDWFLISQPNRKGERPKQHLLGYSGALQADATPAFIISMKGAQSMKSLAGHTPGASFTRSLAQPSPAITEALERIGQLYAIEREVRGSPPEMRLAACQARAKPLLTNLHTWMETKLSVLSSWNDGERADLYLEMGNAASRNANVAVVEIQDQHCSINGNRESAPLATDRTEAQGARP